MKKALYILTVIDVSVFIILFVITYLGCQDGCGGYAFLYLMPWFWLSIPITIFGVIVIIREKINNRAISLCIIATLISSTPLLIAAKLKIDQQLFFREQNQFHQLEIENFPGEWVVVDNTDYSKFTIVLEPRLIDGEIETALDGSYCIEIKDKKDCSDKLSLNGNASASIYSLTEYTADIYFDNLYGGGRGEAQVDYNKSDDSLDWKIINKPEGEFLLPMEAKLIRRK